MTIIEFLTARLDEDEERARRATQGVWKIWGMAVMADQDGTSSADTAVDVAHTVMADEHGKPRTFDAQHIARHDPARVLAEVEAKRRIVSLHHEPVSWQPGRDPSCSSIDYAEDSTDCETLRALALPYADHPDYREEWRVG